MERLWWCPVCREFKQGPEKIRLYRCGCRGLKPGAVWVSGLNPDASVYMTDCLLVYVSAGELRRFL
jgi:hypothetical protein